MKSSTELKRLAREHLTGKYRIVMGALLFSYILPLLLEFPFSSLITGPAPSTSQYIIYYVADILITVLAGVLTIGNASVHLKVSRNQEVTSLHVFSCFKTQTDRYIIGYFLFFLLNLVSIIPAGIGSYKFNLFLTNLILGNKEGNLENLYITIALSAVGIILEVIISLFYGLTFYLLLDRQDLTVLQCFRTSRELLKGKRLKFLYLKLTFIGLHLVSALSFGIGFLWVEPYRQQSYTCFYRNAVGELFDEYA